MTRVCIVGAEDVDLRRELFEHETSREALATYEVTRPFANSVAVETVSLGAAVSLLNDLNWYLLRYADAAMVLEPSISEEEWLSRRLARRVRGEKLPPGETDVYLKVYGVVDGALVEPLYVRRTAEGVPEYDLRDVEETVVVRITADEYGAG